MTGAINRKPRARRRAGATANGFRPPCPVNVLFGVECLSERPRNDFGYSLEIAQIFLVGAQGLEPWTR
jgi:hypothetical protein